MVLYYWYAYSALFSFMTLYNTLLMYLPICLSTILEAIAQCEEQLTSVVFDLRPSCNI